MNGTHNNEQQTYYAYKVFVNGTVLCTTTFEEFTTIKATAAPGVEISAHRIEVDFDPAEADHLN